MPPAQPAEGAVADVEVVTAVVVVVGARRTAGGPVEDRKADLLRLARVRDRGEQVHLCRLIHDGRPTTYLRAALLLEAGRLRAEPPPLPSGPFRVLVADPPWCYEKRSEDASKWENTPYATMSVEEIKALGVASLACPDAVLWLWATNAHLPDAFEVARAWGFSYKTLLTWDKGRMGMGDWLRGQTEHCLLCTRGRPAVLLGGQTTLLRELSRGHSRKPEAFYRLVEALCPGSRVEVFARRRRDGWAAWGADMR